MFTGRMGIGGSQIQMPEDPFSRFIQQAQLLNKPPPQTPMGAPSPQMDTSSAYGRSSAPETMGQITTLNRMARADQGQQRQLQGANQASGMFRQAMDKFGPGVARTLTSEGGPVHTGSVSDFQQHQAAMSSGGVRPGAMPQMNAVEEARKAAAAQKGR